MSQINSRVVNIDELDLKHHEHAPHFEFRGASVGNQLGAVDLGYGYDVVPPGKRVCPFHSHRAEEEMFFIVKGNGLLRYGNESRAVRAGDFICCPTGGPETAHHIINNSDADLAYISVSTKAPVDVCEYPDSDKIGIYNGAGFKHMTERSAHVDYFKGEA